MKLHLIIKGITQSKKAVYVKIFTETWEEVTEKLAKRMKMYYKGGMLRMPYMGEQILSDIIRNQTNAEEIIIH